jgi:hypothetical protein
MSETSWPCLLMPLILQSSVAASPTGSVYGNSQWQYRHCEDEEPDVNPPKQETTNNISKNEQQS